MFFWAAHDHWILHPQVTSQSHTDDVHQKSRGRRLGHLGFLQSLILAGTLLRIFMNLTSTKG